MIWVWSTESNHKDKRSKSKAYRVLVALYMTFACRDLGKYIVTFGILQISQEGALVMQPFQWLSQKHTQDLTLQEFLDEVCNLLKYDDTWAEKLNEKANAFFEEHLIGSTLAMLQTVTETMLVQANLRVLWVYIRDLQEKVFYFFPCECCDFSQYSHNQLH